MTALLLKLQPNQDLTEGLEAAVAEAGFAKARIVSAVGSLVEGVLETGAEPAVVDGPGLEVAALSGDVFADGRTTLHAYICQQNTQVVAGQLVRGRNAVGVTFEVLLEAVPAI